MDFDPDLYDYLTPEQKAEFDMLIEAGIKDLCEQKEGGLAEFIKYMWPVVEPATKLVWSKHIEYICLHLESVANGTIQKVLINVPPGHMKSLLVDVFFPAWIWGPMKRPSARFMAASYSEEITLRDNMRFRDLLRSDRFQKFWGRQFTVRTDQDSKTKIGNDKTGWKIATSVGGMGTGERADFFVIDDPHNIKDAESEAIRENTLQWWREVVPTRLNDPEKSAIIVIMQRVHENDVSGDIIARDLNYEHLCLPARFDPDRKCVTSIWEDPREEDGELLWPERFNDEVLDDLKKQIGKFAFASQFQQSPMPRGGGILQRDYWQLWPPPGREAEWTRDGALQFPVMDYIAASFDGAYTEKQENDYSALAIFGIFRDAQGIPKIMLMHYWQERLTLNEVVAKVAKSCQKYKINKLLIEAKATGISVAQEMRRIYGISDWSTELISPRGDKVARVYSIQHLFEEKMVFAPDREWAETLIGVCERFPRGTHDDGVDCTSQALNYFRATGWALRRGEYSAAHANDGSYESVRAENEPPPYDV